MLFAADVVRPEQFSTGRYWSELGFEEVQKGGGSLALEFRDEIDKLAHVPDAFRSWLKKADPLERTRKRTEWTRGVTASVEALRRTFLQLVSELSDGRQVSAQPLTDSVAKARAEFESLIADAESRVLSNGGSMLSDERAQFAELRAQGTQSLNRFRDDLGPALSQLITAVGPVRAFANKLVDGTISHLPVIDDRIRTRAEHWRIERMAIVDRNVLRLAVYEFLYEDTPHTVVINEGLEIARRFSTFEATQFINGILDAIKLDLEKGSGAEESKKRSQTSSN
jgi:transcription antitermination factor NusB